MWSAPPATGIEVRDASGAVVQSGTTDQLGSFVFRGLPPAQGYAVTVPDLAGPGTVGPVQVMSVDGSLPSPDFYAAQQLTAGYNYITTRDGTKLAAFITLPGPAEKGPYPTVVNYSGYNPAQPGAPEGDYSYLCGSLPVLCDAPTDPSALIMALMGYATVGVNMRGTGCSGGSYDYFEELQLLDGYDIIETVAAQSWVTGHRVGMSGLSYPGISQLFVARTHPPSLAAISPLSVIGNTYSTLRPGGIYNDGFALEWITDVLDGADPYGQGWEQAQVAAGDTVCAENQLLHGQKVNVIVQAQQNPYYSDAYFGPVNPTAFVSEIDVPVFLAGAFEDEQTGPFFFTLLDQFTSSPLTRFTIYNGVHPDGFAPQVLVELKAFLDVYVAHAVPVISADVRTLAPVLFQNVFKLPLQIPPDRFAGYATWEEAKAAYEAEQPLRALFEDGGGMNVGAPERTFEMHFDAWPPPATQPLRLYFQPDGSMAAAPPPPGEASAASSFQLDPPAGHRGILAPGGNVWDPLPAYAWNPLPAGFDVVFETAPLTQDLVMLGSGSVDLWIRSPVDDADLEVNLMEVRPDGQERFVQSGWLRASQRQLDPTATELWPEHSFRQEDEALLVPGAWTEASVGICAFGHVFRAGSRIRVTVDTPGDSRAAWEFALKTYPGVVRYDISHSAMYPSSVLLPVLTGVASTTPLPRVSLAARGAVPPLRALHQHAVGSVKPDGAPVLVAQPSERQVGPDRDGEAAQRQTHGAEGVAPVGDEVADMDGRLHRLAAGEAQQDDRRDVGQARGGHVAAKQQEREHGAALDAGPDGAGAAPIAAAEDAVHEAAHLHVVQRQEAAAPAVRPGRAERVPGVHAEIEPRPRADGRVRGALHDGRERAVAVGGEHVLVDLAERRRLEEAHPEAEGELDPLGAGQRFGGLGFLFGAALLGGLGLVGRLAVVGLFGARRPRDRREQRAGDDGEDGRERLQSSLHGVTEVSSMRSTVHSAPATAASVTWWTMADITPVGRTTEPTSGTYEAPL